jgi:antitoxin component of RelBE/YafQ-DinJ toxin-antitoxin module
MIFNVKGVRIQAETKEQAYKLAKMLGLDKH